MFNRSDYCIHRVFWVISFILFYINLAIYVFVYPFHEWLLITHILYILIVASLLKYEPLKSLTVAIFPWSLTILIILMIIFYLIVGTEKITKQIRLEEAIKRKRRIDKVNKKWYQIKPIKLWKLA